ncbi:hybrid sensor histidine kinase/response regulator [Actimicrobium antarcticum]|uniref:histidine kinase n=1 Tax=Actimicrobium antarcticum TaxID=1051899 RepID=A0ABP7T450_9BURK
MTLRLRLFFLVLASIVPILATQAYNQARFRQERRLDAQHAVELEAKLVAGELEQIAAGMHKFLLAIANSAQIAPDATNCNSYLAALNKQFPGSLSIGVSDSTGLVYCYAIPFEKGTLTNADRPHFKLAQSTDSFVVGNLMVGKETGKRAIGFAYPLPRDAANQPRGIVFASLSVDWLTDHLGRNPLTAGHSLTVVDRTGTILVSLPERSQIGQTVPPLWQKNFSDGKVSVREMTDPVSQVNGIFAFMPNPSATEGIGVVVGINEATAMASANQSLRRALAVAIAGILAALGLAWLIVSEAIERPLQSLLDAARRWRSGDFTARCNLANAPVEMSRLAGAFDTMAESLQLREADRASNELALRRSRDAALAANRSKTQFLAAASHDLRQPLHALSLAVSVMQVRHADDTDTPHLERIGRSVRSLSNLLNTLLDVSQLDAGLVQPTITDCCLKILFAEVAEEFAGIAAQKQVTMQVMPSTLTVRSDGQLLGRMIKNLVSNAIKYTPSGGSVRVHAREDGNQVVIVVADTGIGIASDLQEEVFTDFIQLNNPERDRKKGLGLGLAIVRRMSELLDHPVRLQSVPGAGSTFSIRVTRSTDKVRGVPQQMIHHRYEGRVLLVEDDPLVAEVTAALLTVWGATVTSVASGEAAVTLMQDAQLHFDALITDYRLQKMSGTSVAKAALSRWPAICAVVVTGDANDDILREVRLLGAALLQKPIRTEALAAILQQS